MDNYEPISGEGKPRGGRRTAHRARARAGTRAGFGVAPILYMLGLIGIGAGLLFSSYSQSIKNNINMTNSLAAKSDLDSAATTLAATSVLSSDGQDLCPPTGGGASANCSTDLTVPAPTKMYDFYPAVNAAISGSVHLPSGYAAASGSGSPVEAGVFQSGAGVKQFDPWGHYYVVCRWENTAQSSGLAFEIISAGPDGILQTPCGATAASGDDQILTMNAANAMNRSAIWQQGTLSTGTTGVYYGKTGSQLGVDTSGNLIVPGTITAGGTYSSTDGGIALGSGDISTGGSLLAGIGSFSGALTASSAAISGALTAGSTGSAFKLDSSGNVTTTGSLSAGNGSFAVDSTGNLTMSTGNVTITAGSLTMGASGASVFSVSPIGAVSVGSSLTTLGAVNIATTTPSTGTMMPLLSVGTPHPGTPVTYPFYVDQAGDVVGSNFSGSFSGPLTGNVTGNLTGNVTTTALQESGGTFNVTATGNLNLTGTITATSFSGSMSIGSSGGMTITGVVPIANGGTSASDVATALANLGVTGSASGLGYLNLGLLQSNYIPGADLVSGSVTSTQLDSVVAAGTYNSVQVDASGRVVSGSYTTVDATKITDANGDTVSVGTTTGIEFTVGDVTQGAWTTTGLGIGTTNPGTKLDVNGNVRIENAAGTATPNQLQLMNGAASQRWAFTTDGVTESGGSTGSDLILQGYNNSGTVMAAPALSLTRGGNATFAGSVTATNFIGSGAGLTSIGTASITGTLGTGNGGTGTNQTFSPGSVVFAGANGIYAQDNPQFFWDDANHRLGIGTTTPVSMLETYNGEVQIGSSGAGCSSTNGGALRYSSGNIYYCDGSNTWQTVYGSGSGLGTASLYLGASASATNPARNAAELNTGLYSAGSGLVDVASLGTQVAEFSGSGLNVVTGKVGIGTTNPSAALDILGGYNLPDLIVRSSIGQLEFLAYNDGSNYIESGVSAWNASALLQFTGPNGGGGTFAFNGNVGIGTTNPAAKLDVYGAIDLNGVNGISQPYSDISSIAVGPSALANQSATNSANVAVGYQALKGNTTGGLNTAVGYQSLQSATDNGTNTAVGAWALQADVGQSNTAIGYSALQNQNSANWNTAVGIYAGHSITTGSENVVIGQSVATTTLSTGAYNILIGSGSTIDVPTTGQAGNTSNFLNIGNTIFATGVNTGTLAAPAGLVGIGTTSPNSLLQVYNGEVQVGSSGNTCTSANAGAIRYAAGSVYVCDSTLNWDVLGGAGGGALPSLANGDIWVGNVSNVPTPVALSQDVTITNAGVATVGRIQNVAVGSPTGVAGSAVVLANSPTMIGTASVANIAASGYAATTLEGDYSLTGDLSDAAISAASAVRFTGATATTFEGIAAGVSGQILYLHNASPTATLTLADQSDSTDGTAGSKIITGTGADVTLPANTSMSLQYDTTAQRWRVTGTSNVSGSTVSAGTQYEMAYYSAANVVSGDSGIVTDASNDFLVTAGKVGIGTTGPAAALDVYGGIDIHGRNGIMFPPDSWGVGQSIAIGPGALSGQTSSLNSNIAIGVEALWNVGGTQNTALGSFALPTSPGNYNTAVGSYVLDHGVTGDSNTVVGASAGDGFGGTLGSDNTLLGAFVANGVGGTANNNTAVGYESLGTTGYFGSNNSVFGYQAGYDIAGGSQNIILGYYPTTGVGVTTGSNNILIGYDVQPPSQTASNQLNIGNLIYGVGLGTGGVLSTGNVGIGTAAPGSALQVQGTYGAGTDLLSVYAGAFEAFVVSQWGSVGIGVPNPGAKLDVYTNAGYSQSGRFVTASSGSDGVSIQTDANSSSYFGLEVLGNGGARTDFYVGSNGTVGIGTASPNSLLQVYNGEVQVGSSGNACTAGGNSGAIRYSAGGLYYCDNTGVWQTVYGSGSGLGSASLYLGASASATNPARSAAELNTGLYSAGSGLVDVASLGAQVAEFSGSGLNVVTGKVGIGTTGPAELLTVAKADSGVYAASSTSAYAPWTSGASAVVQAYNTSATDGGAAYDAFKVTNAAGDAQRAYIGAVSTTGSGVYSPALTFGAQSGSGAYNEYMRIGSTGNVGIRTTNPIVALEVFGPLYGASAPFNQLSYDTANYAKDVGSGIGFGGMADGSTAWTFAGLRGQKENATVGDYSGYLSLLTRANGGATTEKMRITSTGNVGIGTTTPASKLQVYNGEVQVGSSGNTCTSANAGAIRYAGGSVYVCDSTLNWDVLGGAGGGALPALANGDIWVGNVSNVPTPVALSQDVTITNAGVATVGRIQNVAVGSPTGVAGSAVVLANSPTMIGTASVANIAASGYAATTLEGDYSLTGDLSDAAISAASAVRFTGATATTFEGIAAGVSGQILYLHNASPTATLTLADQSDSTDGTAGSKIITGTGADVTLPANTSMSLQYDTAAQRWRVTGTSNVSGSTVSAGTQYEMAYYSAANVVSGDSGIVTDASNDFLVTAGKVGIGITAPAQMLDVNGNINVHTIASGYYIANNEVLFQPGGDTNSIAVGQGAAASQAAGWEANTAVGYQALTANTVGSGNTAQGFQALYSNGGNNNTAVGYGVLHYNWGGSNNTAVGSGALYFSNASQSNNNTAVGAGAGSSLSGGNNTILGYQVASSVLGSGSNNILIGTTQYTDTQSPSDSNTLNIGNLIYGTGLGTTSTAPAGYVGIGTASPNFTLDVSGSARINKPGSSGNILELWGNGGWLVKVPASGSNVVLGTGLTWNGITHPFVYNGSGSNSALTIGGGSSTTGSFLDLESTVGAVNPSNDYIVFGVNNAATEAMRIVHSGAVGIGTTSPNSLLQVYNGEVQVGSSGNTCTSANAGAIRYAGGTVYVCDSTLNWDVLGGAGGGALPSLANGDIWVGNVSNVPTPVALSQDVTITNAGVATVGRIQNVAVGSPTGVAGSAVVLANSPTLTGTASVANIAASGYAATTLESDYSLTGDLSDAAISAASAVRFTGATATTFEGIAAGVSGQILYLHNASPTATLTLADQSDSTDGTAGSKIITGTGADITLPANTSMSLQYDTTAQRWRVTGTSNVSGSTVSAGTQYEMAYYSAANVVSGDSGIVTDASNDLLVTGGKVGIGTTGPAAKLDVYGAIDLNGVNGISQPAGDTTGIAVGNGALGSQTATGLHNVAVGYQALNHDNADDNTALGYQALYSLSVGHHDTAIGSGSDYYDTSGTFNTAIGFGALYLNVGGGDNTIVGAFAGGGSGSWLGGSNNTAVGVSALNQIQGNASNNTSLGAGAGSAITIGNSNIAIGPNVANTILSTGSNNILIGTTQYTDTQSPSDSNTLNIGNLIYGTGLGTTSTAPVGNVGIGTASPNFTLDVSGTARINTPGSSGNVLELWGNGGWIVQVPASGSNVVLGTGLTWNGITHPVVYNGSGFGNPNSALTIAGGSSTTGSFLDLEATWGAASPSDDYIVFGVNNRATEAMRIVHSGAVGIGTASPNSLLQVYNGEVQVGSSGNTCTSANAGAIRYAGGSVYVCDSTLNWDVLGGAGGGALPALANGDIWVGNASNAPTPVALSQDVTITNAGVATVGRIQNVAVGSPTGVAGSAVVLANSPTMIGTASVANIAASGYAATTLEGDYASTGDLDDVAISAASAVRFTGATATTFEGIAAGVSGQILYLHNASPTATLTLADQSDSTDGTAGSKIITGTGADVTLPANTSMSLQYDAAAQRWRVTGTSNVSGSTVSAGTQYEMAYYSAANRISGDSGIVTDAGGDLLVTGGKVGIGTTSPANKLDIIDPTNQVVVELVSKAQFKQPIIKLVGYPQGIGDKVGQLSWVWDGNTVADISSVRDANNTTDAQSDLVFSTSGTERLRIDLVGNIGIGTTSPVQALDVNGNVNVEYKSTSSGYYLSGAQALFFPNNDNTSIAIGNGAAGTTAASPTGTSQNTAVGYKALGGGGYNTAVGYQSLASDVSYYNTAVGNGALQNCAWCEDNTVLGTYAGYSIASGATVYSNTIIGAWSLHGSSENINGSGNTVVGAGIGGVLTSGGYNTIMGAGVASTTLSTGSNNILIGTTQYTDTQSPSDSNTLNIGNLIYGTGLGTTSTAPAGYVGIGTTAPSATLDVQSAPAGTGYAVNVLGNNEVNGLFASAANANAITGTSYGGGKDIYGTGAYATAGWFEQVGFNYYNYSTPVLVAYRNNGGNYNTGAVLHVEDNTASPANLLEVVKQSNYDFVINNSGSVGIGTTSPADTLDVTGTGIHIASGTPGATTYDLYNSGGTLYWNGNALLTSGGSGVISGAGTVNYVARWTPNGVTLGTGTLYDNGTQVGIGTTTPAELLTVAKADSGVYAASSTSAYAPWTSGASAVVQAYNTSATDGGAAYDAFKVTNAAGDAQQAYIGAVSTTGSGVYSPALTFGAQSGAGAYNEYMRITGDGNVGIGTTLPSTSLEVDGVTNQTALTVAATANHPASIYAITANGSGPTTGGIYGSSENGTGIEGVAWLNNQYAIYGHSGRGGAGYFAQTGSIYQTYTSPVLYAYRDNGTVGGNDQTGAILRVEENDTSSGNLLEVVKQSNYKFVINNSGNVGIGTASPVSSLQVATGGLLSVTGAYGAGDTLPAGLTGAGTRMFFYPNKGAFRAGTVLGSEWDDANIGAYSVAMGYHTVASGDYSLAAGMSSASGAFSTSMGWNTSAFGSTSTAMGGDTDAAGVSSVSMGFATYAGGDYSTAMGYWTSAGAYEDIALGQYNVGGGNETTWVATDPVFEIGIGTSSTATANAVTVLKNGNVGIGTANPFASLQILGGSGTTYTLDVSNNYSGGNAPIAIKGAVGGTGGVGVAGYTSGSNGVGVYGQSSQSDGIAISGNNAASTGYGGYFSGGATALYAGGATYAGVFMGGNVGIGTTAPSAPLEVVDNQAAGTSINVVNNNSGAYSYAGFEAASGTATTSLVQMSSNYGSYGAIQMWGGQHDFYIYQDGTFTAYFSGTTYGLSLGTYARDSKVPPTNGLIVSGNVGIGTTAPSQPLTVSGNIDVMGGNSGYLTEIANDTATGTGLYLLAKLNSSGAAVIAGAGDSDGVVGVVMGGNGTTGNAQIAVGGQAVCTFDASGVTAAGDFVTISSTTAGDCHDSGSQTRSGLSSQTIGQVLSTTAVSGSNYPITVALNGSGGGVPAGTTGQVQFNSGSSTFAADSHMTWDNTNKILTIGTGAAVPVATTGAMASFVVNVIPQATVSYGVLGSANTGATVGAATAGQVAYYSGANAISGTAALTISGSYVGVGTAAAGQALTVGGNVDVIGNAVLTEIANAPSGTAANELAKLTSGQAATTAITDTDGVVGIVVGGAGTSGNAQIAVAGQAACLFENAAVAGDFVTIGATTAGQCHDAGATRPASGGETVGRVLASGPAGSAYAVAIAIAPSSGNSGNTAAAFSFTNQTGVSMSSAISSNAVTLSGFSGTLTATCGTGCTAIARNGTWGGTTVSGFQSGDTIAIRQTSSASANTGTNATVTVGTTVSGTWTVTTNNNTASAFSFTNQTGVSGSIPVISNAVVVSGFSGTLTATCNAGCTNIAHNGVWSGTIATGVAANDTIAIQQISSTTTGGTATASVTVGSTVSGTWTVTTGADACPAVSTPGTVCGSGLVYAGVSPDTGAKMYTTPCDANAYWNGSSCTACASGVWTGSGTSCSTTINGVSVGAGPGMTWNNGTGNWILEGVTSSLTGKANTAFLVASTDMGYPYKAADYCASLSSVYGYSDWYLPSASELNVLYSYKGAIGNFNTGGSYYWSSTEYDSYNAWYQQFSGGNQGYYGKNDSYLVRCVRR